METFWDDKETFGLESLFDPYHRILNCFPGLLDLRAAARNPPVPEPEFGPFLWTDENEGKLEEVQEEVKKSRPYKLRLDEEKLRFLERCQEVSLSAACREFGISKSVGANWRDKWAEGSLARRSKYLEDTKQQFIELLQQGHKTAHAAKELGVQVSTAGKWSRQWRGEKNYVKDRFIRFARENPEQTIQVFEELGMSEARIRRWFRKHNENCPDEDRIEVPMLEEEKKDESEVMDKKARLNENKRLFAELVGEQGFKPLEAGHRLGIPKSTAHMWGQKLEKGTLLVKPRREKYPDEKKRFIELIEQGHEIGAAAEKLRVNLRTAYDWSREWKLSNGVAVSTIKHHPEETRREFIELVTEQSYSVKDAYEQLGVPKDTAYAWLRLWKERNQNEKRRLPRVIDYEKKDLLIELVTRYAYRISEAAKALGINRPRAILWIDQWSRDAATGDEGLERNPPRKHGDLTFQEHHKEFIEQMVRRDPNIPRFKMYEDLVLAYPMLHNNVKAKRTITQLYWVKTAHRRPWMPGDGSPEPVSEENRRRWIQTFDESMLSSAVFVGEGYVDLKERPSNRERREYLARRHYNYGTLLLFRGAMTPEGMVLMRSADRDFLSRDTDLVNPLWKRGQGHLSPIQTLSHFIEELIHILTTDEEYAWCKYVFVDDTVARADAQDAIRLAEGTPLQVVLFPYRTSEFNPMDFLWRAVAEKIPKSRLSQDERWSWRVYDTVESFTKEDFRLFYDEACNLIADYRQVFKRWWDEPGCIYCDLPLKTFSDCGVCGAPHPLYLKYYPRVTKDTLISQPRRPLPDWMRQRRRPIPPWIKVTLEWDVETGGRRLVFRRKKRPW